MNQDQVMSLIRVVLQVLGTLATTLGWASPETVSALTAQIFAIAGPLMVLGGTIWSMISNTKTSIIKSATNMPEVDSRKLAAAIDDPTLKAAATQPPK